MKNALWIFAVLLLTFVADRGIGYYLQQKTENSQFRYARLYDNRAEADILLVGNSRGLIFYQPYIEEVTAQKTFNLSYNGMPTDLANVLVKDYFDRYPAPEKMVVDVTMCDRINDQLTASFKLYAPYSERLRNLLKERNETAYNGMRFSHLFRYNTEIFQRSLFYQNKTDEDWLLDRVISDNMVNGTEKLEPYTINYQPDSTAYLTEQLADMVAYAEARGTEVELVINPYFPAFAQKIDNIPALRAEMQRKTGLPVKDYSLAVRDTQGFGDYQHLNKAGARAFIDRMLAEGVLR